MRTDDEILSLLAQRRADRGTVLARMAEVRDTYNNDIVVPLPERDASERSMTANTLAIGLDAHAQRVASTQPVTYWPVMSSTATARQQAKTRKAAVEDGFWEDNHLGLRLYRAARFYGAYGVVPMHVRPSKQKNGPEYHLRQPLSTFIDVEANEDLYCNDGIFISRTSLGKLVADYPDTAPQLMRLVASNGQANMGAPMELIEYVDHDEWVLLAGPVVNPLMGVPHSTWEMGTSKSVRLDRIANRIDRCPVVQGGRFGLDRPVGQFDQLVGMYAGQSKLMALEMLAVERGVFPDIYVIADNMGNPIIDEADGITGKVGTITGGKIEVIQQNPSYMTPQMIDRLERGQRVAGRIPAEFSGEAGSGIRTGRRGDSILAQTVDFPVQEAQRMLAELLNEANEIAIAVDKAYFGTTTKTFYVTRGPRKAEKLSYTPAELWADDDAHEHEVAYAHPGADANALEISVMQRVGAGLMSKTTAQVLDPYIDDPELEHDLVIAEALELAMLQGIQKQAAEGTIPPTDLARIMQLVSDDALELAAAVMKAQAEAQARQATPAPMGAPETQPGLGAPGMGAEQPPASIGGPTDGSANLVSLLGNIRMAQAQMGPEQSGGAVQGQPQFA